ncbi:MAG: hypothetical protein HY898_13230 [Deltaproteobacteria bacterium]|nr:hypothetical protein [Deltaproteobacteria bacterium]
MREHAGLLAALLVIALLFSPCLGFRFVNWDDDIHVYRNPLVVAPATTSWSEALRTPALGYPSPLTVASYRLEHWAVGLAPWLYHLDNVLLHLLVCALVYQIAVRLALSRAGGTVAVLVFGLHPAVVEPVVWVTGRKDLLAAAGVLAGASVLLRRGETGAKRGALVALWGALGGLAKPVALFLPLLIVAWSRLLSRLRWTRALVVAAPSAVVLSPLFVLALTGQLRVGAVSRNASMAAVLREAWYALGFHLALVLGLRTPSAKHLVLRPPAFDPWVDLVPLAFGLVVVAALWVLDGRRRRIALAGLIFSALAYLPSANLIPLVRYLADSYVYLPLAGLAWSVGAACDALGEAIRPRPRWLHLAFAGAGVVGLAVIASSSIGRVPVWRNGVTLWTDVALHAPPSPNVCRQLGNAYNELEQHDRALAQYQACARQFDPALFRSNIGVTLFVLGRHDEARDAFRAILLDRPGDPIALKYLGLLDGR